MSERSALADFIRARREQVSPADVGLRDSGRRRTPGLRREELATLAGVSIDYLVRLEQGRDTNPSAAVMASIAEALRLTPDERHHMAILAAQGNTPNLCPSLDTEAAVVLPDTVQVLLDRLAPAPAFVLGAFSDVLGWNDPWQRLVEPMGLLVHTVPNLAWYTFAEPTAATVFVDWAAAADEQAGRLRQASVRWRDDPRFEGLLAELLPRPEFERRWTSHVVAEKRRGTKALRHPELGELQVAYEVLGLPDVEQVLVTWLPADAATEERLQSVSAGIPTSPARLRVVGGS